MSSVTRIFSAIGQAIGTNTLRSHKDGSFTTPNLDISYQQFLGYYQAQRSFFKISPVSSQDGTASTFEVTQHFATANGQRGKKEEITPRQIKRILNNVGNSRLSRSFKKTFPVFRDSENSRLIGNTNTLAGAKNLCVEEYRKFRNNEHKRFFAVS